jgi:hypothetical protein
LPLVNRAPKPTDVVVQVYLREGEAEGHLQAQGHQEALQGAAYEGGGEAVSLPRCGGLTSRIVRKPCD